MEHNKPSLSQAEQDKIRVYNAILFAHKGSLACENERKRFALCRATAVGGSGDPSFCEQQAADFLQCYHEMVQYVRKDCREVYMQSVQCLQEADSKGFLSSFTKVFTDGGIDDRMCHKQLTDFQHC
ncbi:hypothetical protein FGO68_gene12813 [Halteria grandinella]|uniref:Uncharacterized protein n=1 Tax=Halteria grandinella TaxID=5974 RepID=A0A8J8NG86_HALGN|nr:hypothetical protein FGO68_gene12813 [Halteria grandinella]